MKKFLVVLLALVMVFAFSAVSLADNPGVGDVQIESYTDMDGVKDAWARAVAELTALGVLRGDGDGTFRPSSNLNRAEFAVIALYLIGEEDTIAYYGAQKSVFADVKEDFWGKPYINAAYAAGLVVGRSATVFDPYANVSFQEVATVILRALGDTTLSYPNGYAKKAADIGLTEYVNYVGPQAITRAEMASITAESLDCYMVRYVGGNDVAAGIGTVIGTVDADGYQYTAWSTNEKNNLLNALRTIELDKTLYNTMFGWNSKYVEDLLEEIVYGLFAKDLRYNTFGAVKVDKIFTFVPFTNATMLEATGWMYENFDKGELAARLIPSFDVATLIDLVGDFIDDELDMEVPYFSTPFASRYGIYGGSVVDLGGQTADLTLNSKGEIVFVEITSETYMGKEANKQQLMKFFTNPEYDFASMDSKGKISDGKDFYAVYNYEWYMDAPFGVVKSASTTAINFAGGSTLGNITLKNNDIAIWDMTAKQFVLPEDLAKGTALYNAGYVDNLKNKVTLYLAFAPQEADLTKQATLSVVLDDTTLNVLNGFRREMENKTFSLLSYDGGDNFYNYRNNYTYNLLGEVTFANAYVPGYFAQITAKNISYGYGVINRFFFTEKSYVYKDQVAQDRVPTIISGVEIVLPNGDYETYDISHEYYVVFDRNHSIPTEGDLVNFSLNKDGEIVWFGGFNGKVEWHGFLTNHFCIEDTAYQYGKTVKITKSSNADQNIITINGDVYRIKDSAVIYVLNSVGGIGQNANRYDFNSATVLSTEKFVAAYAGTTSVGEVCAYKNSNNEITVLYVVNPNTKAEKIGYLTDAYTTKDGNFLEVNDDTATEFARDSFRGWSSFLNAHGSVTAIRDNAIVIYKTENGKVVDLYVIFEEGDIKAMFQIVNPAYDAAAKAAGKAMIAAMANTDYDPTYDMTIIPGGAGYDAFKYAAKQAVIDAGADPDYDPTYNVNTPEYLVDGGAEWFAYGANIELASADAKLAGNAFAEGKVTKVAGNSVTFVNDVDGKEMTIFVNSTSGIAKDKWFMVAYNTDTHTANYFLVR